MANQCSTLTFLDIWQWASKHDKSLAHKGKPLVQNKARKNTPTKARELGTITLLVSYLFPENGNTFISPFKLEKTVST